MKRERQVLTGLGAVFLTELAIGIPAAFHRDATDDAQPRPRPVTTVPSVRVAARALPVVPRRVAVAKVAPSPVLTLTATAKPTATSTATVTVVPKATATPAASAEPPRCKVCGR